MLTRLGMVSVRGLWRDALVFPDASDGTPTNLVGAMLEMQVRPTEGWQGRDDYGWRVPFLACTPALTATTSGSGQGTLILLQSNTVQFYFPASAISQQKSGIYEASILATVGPETSEIFRDFVVFV